MFVPHPPDLPSSKPRLQQWLDRLVWLFAWGLLIAGLMLALAWASLHFWIVPRIDEFRPGLERLARQSLGVPVRIGSLSAQSTGWVPSFELRDIELLDEQGRSGLRLPKVLIALSLQSAMGLKLDQLVLDAPELAVRQTAEGHWQVAGMDWGSTLQGDTAAADWLFSQREIIVRGGVLRWHASPSLDQGDEPSKALQLQDVDLVIRNSARKHSVRLDATPPVGWGERFVLMGQFRRKLLSTHAGRHADWSGQAYAFFPQADLAQLRAAAPTQWTRTWGPVQGEGVLRLWADVDQGQWRGAVADLSLVGFRARLNEQELPLAFERLSGRVGVQIHEDGFLASTQGLSFVNDEGLHWPGGNVSLDYTRAVGSRPARGVLQADQLDLHALRELTLRLPQAAAVHPALQARDIAGLVRHLHLRWQGDWPQPETYEAKASIQGLRWQPDAADPTPATGKPRAHWPGFRGADVNLNWRHDGGQIGVQMSHDSALWLPGILSPAEVPIQSLQANVRWERLTNAQGGGWRVPQWDLKMTNADLRGEWRGHWQSLTEGPGKLSLDGTLEKADAAAVYRYLPLGLPASVRDYLQDALVKGSYNNVSVKIKGDLAKLPFANPQDGEFRFSGSVKDILFDMVPASILPAGSPSWPRLHGLQGQLTFDRLGLRLKDISTRAGEGANAVVLTSPMLEIADMTHQPLLRVRAESQSKSPDVLRLIQQSALSPLLSNALQGAQVRGDMQTRFELRLPLLNLAQSRVHGQVVFNNNDLRLLPDTPWLEKLQGQLQFHEAGFVVQRMRAQLWGGPVVIEGGMRPSKTAPAPTVEFQARGSVSAEGLRTAKEFYPLDWLAQHAQGSTTYSARLGWREGQPDLVVQSSLEGLAVNMPAPLGKPAKSASALHIRMRARSDRSGPQDHIQINLADNTRIEYVRSLSGKVPTVLRGIWGVGIAPNQMPALPDSGVSANVVMDRLDVDEWLALMPDSKAVGTGPSPRPTPGNDTPPVWQTYLPTRMGLKAQTLTLSDRSLHQVTVGGTRDGTLWRTNIDAREMSGNLTYQQSLNGQPGLLFARLSRLNLPPAELAEVETLLEAPPTQLPALDIVVDALTLRGIQMGRVEIEAINQETSKTRSATGSEWQLKKFNILLPEAQMKSTGRWSSVNEGSPLRKTAMDFVLDVQDAGALLNRLGTPNALRGGVGQLSGTIHWQGSPLALDYPSMNGQMEVRMGRGQFLKADAGAAKLLGVLSLQALPRRLLLDFRDVFAEGFAFDSLRGDVTISKGMAQTRNLQIKGVNALVLLEGEAGLSQETQNLRVKILPLVDTGTTSLLAGMALNPAVGLTAFVAQWLLKNPLARASSQEFLIDGNWDNPRVTRIDKRP